ncbi:hypothetical protein FQN57_001312 [Myotisia sp. PD_48]|nr:hypothetical protein FQN57_001312 [Myotisia sp. PD_48]
MSYSASKTWVSEETKEFENWVKTRDSMMCIAPKSPFIPKSFREWLCYKVLKKEDERRKVLRDLTARQTRSDKKTARINRIFAGKILNDQLSLVLASKSIWSPLLGSANSGQFAAWPTYDEYKHEGDDRNKSRYSRFPPLPREPGNETVNWKQRKPLDQHAFDELGRQLIRENDECETGLGDIAMFVGSSFLRFLDAGKPF